MEFRRRCFAKAQVRFEDGRIVSRRANGEIGKAEAIDMATSTTPQDPDGEINDSDKPGKSIRRSVNPLLRKRGGPTTLQGKRASRQNATKHGIFAVGIIPQRESKAQYDNMAKDMVETLQPVGSLEEILVEKLTMLVWRYRRLLQAEAAEVASQAEKCEQGYLRDKGEAADKVKTDQGLIRWALEHYNEEALRQALTTLNSVRFQIRQEGLDWVRDQYRLREVYGPLSESGTPMRITTQVEHDGRVYEGLDPNRLLAKRYRELAGTGQEQQSAPNAPRDAAEAIVGMLTEEIGRFESMLQVWQKQGDDRNQFEETRALVPWEDRLQRYESSLERSFDRTLSQLERLQRLRLGQPVLPALKVDVSHLPG
jgi:hypothetical protein